MQAEAGQVLQADKNLRDDQKKKTELEMEDGIQSLI